MEIKRNKMSFYKSIIKKMRKDKSEMHIIDAKNEKITREICTKEILDLLDAPGGKSWGMEQRENSIKKWQKIVLWCAAGKGTDAVHPIFCKSGSQTGRNPRPDGPGCDVSIFLQ